MNGLVVVSDEVAAALAAGRGVVALETTLVAHGFPGREGLAVARECERRVREAGAVPATVGVLDGRVRVGLGGEELERFDAHARKVGPRDLAAAAVQGAVGATTVGGTLAAAGRAGIRFLGTGGIGGVHRGWQSGVPDVSADLGALARSQALVVSSGVKSLLDVAATAELLETLGIPVLGYRTAELPLFYAACGGPPLATCIETAAEAAALARAHWSLGGASLVVAQPASEPLEDVEPLIERGLAAASAAGISGQAVTPWVLAFLHRESGGRTLRTNKRLVADNAGLAAAIAAADAALSGGAGAGSG